MPWCGGVCPHVCVAGVCAWMCACVDTHDSIGVCVIWHSVHEPVYVGGGRERGTEITVYAPERHCLQLRASGWCSKASSGAEKGRLPQ